MNKSITWLTPDGDREWFSPLESALDEPEGLLAAGGDLSPARLLAAYRRGIFPWYSAGQPVLWWSPDPREVLDPAEFRLTRSLAKTVRNRALRSLSTATSRESFPPARNTVNIPPALGSRPR